MQNEYFRRRVLLKNVSPFMLKPPAIINYTVLTYILVPFSFYFYFIKGWLLKIFVVTSPRLRCVIWWTRQDSRFLSGGISLNTTTSGSLVYQQEDALQTKKLFFRTHRYKKQRRLTIPINTFNGYLCDLIKEFLIFQRRKDKTLCRQCVL